MERTRNSLTFTYASQGSKPFKKEDHVRLKECLSRIQGKFLLSINDHPEIRELYCDFNINQVEVRYSVCRTDKTSKAKELFISNYEVGVGKMKILATPIEAMAWFENGKTHPLRFKLDGKELKIDKVVKVTEEKLAGNRMLVFHCQSEINGELQPFELKYELNTCKWYLWKM